MNFQWCNILYSTLFYQEYIVFILLFHVKTHAVIKKRKREEEEEIWLEIGKVVGVGVQLKQSYAAIQMPRSPKKIKAIMEENKILQKRRQILKEKVVNLTQKDCAVRKEEISSCSFCRVSLASARCRYYILARSPRWSTGVRVASVIEFSVCALSPVLCLF